LEEVLELFVGEHILDRAKNDLPAVFNYIAEVRNNLIVASSLGIAGENIKIEGKNNKTAGCNYKTAG
jgi:hypothetical protein